ncbi:MAG: alpha/beta hydrolase [Pseudorhodoplanes sp.]
MNLVSIPANPVPEDYLCGSLKTPDGVTLRFARWAPPPGRKGTVCIFQGRAEFIEKYFETVRDLRQRGFAVAALDWRGQGLSERQLSDPRKGHVRDFAEYQTDLETFMREVVLPDCPPPYFALGHSTGAAVLLRVAKEGHRWFDRMVFSAPLIRLAARQDMVGIAAPTVRILRMLGFGRSYVPKGDETVIAAKPFIGNLLTSDPVRHARAVAVLAAEPALGIGSPTVAWTDAAFRMMREFAAPSYAASIRQPILAVAAGHDEIVSTAATEEFARRLRAGAQLIVPGSRHELLMEQDRFRNQFLAAFDAFVPGTPLY